MTKVFDAYAAYYDLLYKDKDYSGEAEFVQTLLSKNGINNGSVLDLGCGTGKHAIHLARQGYSVLGIDISLKMIERARSNLPGDLNDQITYREGDVRTARVGRKFDVVTSLFHVASYQTNNDDIIAMFKTAYEHLAPGGVFIFDCWYGPGVLTDRPAERVKRMEGEGFRVNRKAEPMIYPNDNTVAVNYSVEVTQLSSSKSEIINETHLMRYFFAPELRYMLAESGFRDVSIVEWGSGNKPGFKTWSAAVVAFRC